MQGKIRMFKLWGCIQCRYVSFHWLYLIFACKTSFLEVSLGASCAGLIHRCRAGPLQPFWARFILHQLSSRASTLLKNLLILELNFKGITPASQKEGLPYPAHHPVAWVFLAAWEAPDRGQVPKIKTNKAIICTIITAFGITLAVWGP